MKVLVLGGTGVIGTSLILSLERAGSEIWVTSRKTLNDRQNVKFLKGDAQDDQFLSSLLSTRWDAIIDFMAYTTPKFLQRFEQLYRATDQYVFLSSCRVFAASQTDLDECSPRLLDVCTDPHYLTTDEYGLAKARQEDYIRQSSSTNWTIVRPYITFGKGRFQLGPLEKEDWLYRAVRGRKVVFCKDLMNRTTTLTNSDTVAGMIASLVGRSEAICNDFNLTSGIGIQWADILQTYSAVLRETLRWTGDVVLQNLDEFCLHTKPEQVKFDRAYDRRFSTNKIAPFFDLNTIADPLVDLRASFEKQLAGETRFRRINWRAEALRDKASGEYVDLTDLETLSSLSRYLFFRHVPVQIMRQMKIV
ncbi:NAD-dependent epimerase/dehydratase family protein [Yoonia litorea]|uniref:UDP-glucose 4-epimerase n=1 Tax=Yoonia litorea TaxID=1123755 RepID=A0A1I6MVP9_9RHOB|nr:NAD-dependent epimerase/dehydratase family protein [Yoonia litorea]SFS19749.1 Nucleoside-diphosphate-sugar epimerase [Yoonia litorea]